MGPTKIQDCTNEPKSMAARTVEVEDDILEALEEIIDHNVVIADLAYPTPREKFLWSQLVSLVRKRRKLVHDQQSNISR